MTGHSSPRPLLRDGDYGVLSGDDAVSIEKREVGRQTDSAAVSQSQLQRSRVISYFLFTLPAEARRRSPARMTPLLSTTTPTMDPDFVVNGEEDDDVEKLRFVLRSKCHQLRRLCLEGSGIEFKSRISPSPSRSRHGNRRRKSRTPSSDAGGEGEDSRLFASENVINASSSSAAAASGTLISESDSSKSSRISNYCRRNLMREFSSPLDTLPESSSSPAMPTTRRQSARRVSDKRSDVAADKTPDRKEAKDANDNVASSKKGSPRLQAFDGNGWISAPRTGYTYLKSPTYRDSWTPDRADVPMPHMTRMPLGSFGSSARRNLFGDFSDDEEEEGAAAAAAGSNYYRGGTALVSQSFSLIAMFFLHVMTWMRFAASSCWTAVRHDIPSYLMTKRSDVGQSSTLVIHEIVHVFRSIFISSTTYFTRAARLAGSAAADCAGRVSDYSVRAVRSSNSTLATNSYLAWTHLTSLSRSLGTWVTRVFRSTLSSISTCWIFTTKSSSRALASATSRVSHEFVFIVHKAFISISTYTVWAAAKSSGAAVSHVSNASSVLYDVVLAASGKTLIAGQACFSGLKTALFTPRQEQEDEDDEELERLHEEIIVKEAAAPPLLASPRADREGEEEYEEVQSSLFTVTKDNLKHYLSLLLPKRKPPRRKSARLRRRKKEPTWLDYLPVAWRNDEDDDDEIPFWFWLLLVLLIPFALIFLAYFLPLMPKVIQENTSHTVQATKHAALWVVEGAKSIVNIEGLGLVPGMALQSLSAATSHLTEATLLFGKFCLGVPFQMLSSMQEFILVAFGAVPNPFSLVADWTEVMEFLGRVGYYPVEAVAMAGSLVTKLALLMISTMEAGAHWISGWLYDLSIVVVTIPELCLTSGRDLLSSVWIYMTGMAVFLAETSGETLAWVWNGLLDLFMWPAQLFSSGIGHITTISSSVFSGMLDGVTSFTHDIVSIPWTVGLYLYDGLSASLQYLGSAIIFPLASVPGQLYGTAVDSLPDSTLR